MTMNPTSSDKALSRRLATLRARIAAAAARGGRPLDRVTLVAVTKGVDPALVIAACAAGIADLGENRLQDAAERLALVQAAGLRPRWHFIGHLQRNKAARVVETFDTVDTVDSLALAQRLSATAEQQGRRLPVLIQVNAAADPAKHGLAPQAVEAAAAAMANLPGLAIEGLMAILPETRDEQLLRPAFARLTTLRDRLRLSLPQLSWERLSMGMSDDFELAVEMGATEVRLGRALFGDL